jgi:hypothetical protein
VRAGQGLGRGARRRLGHGSSQHLVGLPRLLDRQEGFVIYVCLVHAEQRLRIRLRGGVLAAGCARQRKESAQL